MLGVVAFALLARGLDETVDASLGSVARTVAATRREAEERGAALDEALARVLGPVFAARVFRLLDPLGRPDPRLGGGPALPLGAAARSAAARGEELFETVELADGPARLLTMPVLDGGRPVALVQVAASLATVRAVRRRFVLIMLGLAPLALAGVAAGGWLLADRALRRVDAMVAIARRSGAGDLSQRIPTEGHDDELGRLAAVLNDMLARLERSFAAVREFSADAAHELRTPLTILKGEIGVALHGAPDAAEHRRVLESCLEEVDRLAALVDDLLFLARADAGRAEAALERVDLAALVDDVVPAVEALAARAGVRVTVTRRGPAWVRGSAPMLFRLVLNLADNAVAHAGGRVDVTVEAREGRAVLAVCDDGPGIPPAERERIFERFHRGEPSHGRGGAGLGLAIVRSIVLVHRGDVAADGREGGGTCLRVRLPADDAASPVPA